jgi:hypothetical protein
MQEVFTYYTLEPIAAFRLGARSTDRVGLCRASQPNSATYIWGLHKAVAVAPQVSTEWQAPPSGLSVPGHGHGSAILGPSLEWDAAERQGGPRASRPLRFEADAETFDSESADCLTSAPMEQTSGIA